MDDKQTKNKQMIDKYKQTKDKQTKHKYKQTKG